MMRRTNSAPTYGAALLCAVVGVAGCGLFTDEPLDLPTVPEARSFYSEHAGISAVRVNGNVVVLEVTQPARQLARGGSLWARVGPYIHLFSPSTRSLLEGYPDVAAVRVITHAPGEREIARAMLVRDTMSELLWRRSLNLLGHALNSGTSNPDRLSQLAEWGESYTKHAYNADYVPVPE